MSVSPKIKFYLLVFGLLVLGFAIEGCSSTRRTYRKNEHKPRNCDCPSFSWINTTFLLYDAQNGFMRPGEYDPGPGAIPAAGFSPAGNRYDPLAAQP